MQISSEFLCIEWLWSFYNLSNICIILVWLNIELTKVTLYFFLFLIYLPVRIFDDIVKIFLEYYVYVAPRQPCHFIIFTFWRYFNVYKKNVLLWDEYNQFPIEWLNISIPLSIHIVCLSVMDLIIWCSWYIEIKYFFYICFWLKIVLWPPADAQQSNRSNNCFLLSFTYIYRCVVQ